MYCTPNSPEGLSSWARAAACSRDLAGHSDKDPSCSTVTSWHQDPTKVGCPRASPERLQPLQPQACLGGSRLAAEVGDNGLSLLYQFSFLHSYTKSIRRQWSVFQHGFLLLKGGGGQETGLNSSLYTESVEEAT